MPVNLLNEKDLNNYLTDIVYMGQETPTFTSGNFKSIDYVQQHKDAIVKAMLAQYMKHRLRAYLSDKEDVPFLSKLELSPDLPGWAERSIQEGRPVFRFDASKMSPKMRGDITLIRDFLYSAAESYIDKSLATAEHTKQSPKLRLEYLKTTNEYDTFEKTLAAAKKWHEIMGKEAEKKAKDKELFEKSLKGTEFIMDLPNGMAAYRLTTPEALDFESEYMGHCVGKGGYDESVKTGKTQIYSIRDKNGEPHATFHIMDHAIYQCKGKGNKAPVAKYRPAVQEFVRQMKFDIAGDTTNIGFLRQDGEYYDIYHLPKGFVVNGDLDFSDQDITELPDLSTVTVNGNFDCSFTQLTSLKGSPQIVKGSFRCSSSPIISLEGMPQIIGKNFYCINTQITSLKGMPSIINGHFDCSGTKITTLKGGPQKVGGCFACVRTPLTSLEGGPQTVGEDFDCGAASLTSLKGAPRKIKGRFSCTSTQITSLEGAPQTVGSNFDCAHTPLTTLRGAPREIKGAFNCSYTSITSLEGGPEKVGGNFNCRGTQITSFIGAPKKVGGEIDCRSTRLTSVEGSPRKVALICDTEENAKIRKMFEEAAHQHKKPSKMKKLFDFLGIKSR